MRMLNRARNRSGQSMAEYAIVLTVVIGAIIAMQLYVKRGLQGKVKDVTDNVGVGLGAMNQTNQYEPYYASSDYNVKQSQAGRDDFQTGGSVYRQTDKEDTTRTGSSKTAGAP